MPRAGLTGDDVVASAAGLADEIGFQWDADPDESFEWMIGFIDRGLRSG